MEPTASQRWLVEKMPPQGDGAGACRKFKEEPLDSEYVGFGSDFDRTAERMACTTRRRAADAGFGVSFAAELAKAGAAAKDHGLSALRPSSCQPHVKFSSKADLEAFHAQFELLARAAAWPDGTKALQLALWLTDEALVCLLLLSPAGDLDNAHRLAFCVQK